MASTQPQTDEFYKSQAPLPVQTNKITNYGSFESRDSSAELPKLEDGLSLRREKLEGQEENGGDCDEKRSLLLKLADRIPCLGIMLALCASLFLGSAGMLVKLTHSVHGIQVAVLRSTIQLLIYGFVISVRRLPLLPEASEVMPVMGRAFLGATSITFSYYALKLIPLGDATTIRFSLPIWTLIISYLVLGEPCNLLRIMAVIISVSGVVLIAKPEECVYLSHMVLRWLTFESDLDFTSNKLEYELYKFNGSSNEPIDPEQAFMPTNGSMALNGSATFKQATAETKAYQQFEGSLLALGSSICLSLSLIALRLCRKTSAEIVIFWLSLISILIGSMTLVALNEWSLPNNWPDVLYILLNGLCGTVGQWFITNALKIEQSGIISLVRTFDIEVAFIYSAFLLHEQIRTTSIVGSILVTTGVVSVLLPKWLWASDKDCNANQSDQKQLEDQEDSSVDSGTECGNSPRSVKDKTTQAISFNSDGRTTTNGVRGVSCNTSNS